MRVDDKTANYADIFIKGRVEAKWNNDIYFNQSSPFAMDEGTKVADLARNLVGFENDSYFRSVAFDLSVLGLDSFDFNAHWTMSCGNDVIAGGDKITRIAKVPEPGSISLILMGLLAVFLLRRRQGSDEAICSGQVNLATV